MYRLENSDDAKRLAELIAVPNPTALVHELGLARLMLEKAVNVGNLNAAVALQNVIGKLAQVSEVARYRKGELLCKAAVLQIAEKMALLLTQSIENKFPGWEEAIDDVRNGVFTIVAEAQNPDQHAPLPDVLTQKKVE